MITVSRKAKGGCIFCVTDVAHVRQVGKLTQGLACPLLGRNNCACYSQILN